MVLGTDTGLYRNANYLVISFNLSFYYSILLNWLVTDSDHDFRVDELYDHYYSVYSSR